MVSFIKAKKDGKWHKYIPLFLVRLENGKMADPLRSVWYKWDGKKWIHRQYKETFTHWYERQW